MHISKQYREAGPSHVIVAHSEWFFGNHIRKQEDVEAHDHNYLELAFVLSGKTRHITIDGSEQCGRGDLLVIPHGAWHSYSDSRNLELVNCLLSPSMLQNELAWLATDQVLGAALGLSVPCLPARPSRWRISPSYMDKLRPLLFDLLKAYAAGAARVEVLGRLLLLLAQVRKVIVATSPKSPASQQIHSAVTRGITLLNADISVPWTLGELAAQLRLNSSYLVRLFRIHTGMPPMKYLDALRADRAATLLFVSDLPIGRIGELVGWDEPKLFARQFRQHFGMSATRYRAHLLNGG